MLDSLKKFFKGPEADILIIEDSEQTQKTLCEILGILNVVVRTANSGEVAFELLKTKYIPSLIILDLNLPGMTGVQVLDALQINIETMRIPVISFSSTLDERTNQAYEKHEGIVRQYMQSLKFHEKSGNARISEIIPKFQGQEGVDIVHPKLIACIAGELMAQGVELSPEFQHLVYIAQKQIDRINKK